MAIHALFKNLLFSGISQVVRLLANTILFIFIARTYGAEGFGSFTTAHAYYLFFLLISDFGLDTYILTLAQQKQQTNDKTISDLFTIKLVLIVVAAFSLFVLSFVMDIRAGTSLMVLLLSVALVGSALTTFSLAVLKSKEIFQPDATVNVLQNGLLLSAILIVWLFDLDIIVLLIAFAGSRFIGLHVLQALIRKHCMLTLMSIREAWSRHSSDILTYGMHLLFGTLFFTSDSLLIPVFYDEQMNGAYQSVFKLAVLALMFSDILVLTYLPTLSRLFQQDQGKWDQLSMFLHKIITVAGMIAGIIFFFFPGQLLTAIYGTISFPDGEMLMKIFAGIIFIRSATIVFGFMLTSASLQKTRLKITVYATIGNVIANVLVLPVFGIIGAAVVSLCTNIGVGILFVYYASSLPYSHDLRFFVLISGMIVMLSAITMVAGIPIWFAVSCASAAFLTVMAVWGFREHEREYFRTITRGLLYRIKVGG